MRGVHLRALSSTLHGNGTEDDDDKHVDFASVGLYLVGIQTLVATLLCAAASVLCCWLLPAEAVSAVRTLALTSLVGLAALHKPLRIGRVRGVAMLFNALRPSVAVYVLCLVVEQLLHTCPVPLVRDQGHDTHDAVTGAQLLVHYATSVMLLLSGALRARHPRSESDLSFAIAFLALLVAAAYPPAMRTHHGPLCESVGVFAACERLLRAGAFSSAYVTVVYAAAPVRNVSTELFVCVARATAAALWTMVVPAWALFLAPVQIVIVLAASLEAAPPSGATSHDDDYAPRYTSEGVPLTH